MSLGIGPHDNDCQCARCVSRRAEYATQAAQASAANSDEPKKERDWRTMGIVELAVENQSVSDYIEHWEGRTLEAEDRLEKVRQALSEPLHLLLEIRNLAHRAWLDPPNAEFLFREIGAKAQKISTILSEI